jgi:Zn-dependent alcohol dehydrogenase
VKIRGVVLEQTGGPLTLTELDLADPGPEEVLVRLHASGVCHSDWNAVDGTAESICPVVLGHEGGGVVEAVGAGVTRVAVGDHVALSWTPSCGACEECLRDLPWHCSTAWPAMGTGGLMDGTTRLTRNGGEPVYHYSFLSTFAEACVVPERSCIPFDRDVPFEIAGLVGCGVSTGVGAVWRTAGVRPGDRVAIVGCGGVGPLRTSGRQGGRCGADRRRRRRASKLEFARELGADRTVLVGSTPRRPRRPCESSPAAASTMRSRRPVGPRRCRRRSSRHAGEEPPSSSGSPARTRSSSSPR